MHQKLASKLATMVERHVVEAIPLSDTSTIRITSRLFPVPKGANDIRPVFDLRHLNSFLVTPHFKMEDLRTAIAFLETGDYLTKVDIRDAYTHVSMHPNTRPFLVFPWSTGWYRFITLPFGLSTAPMIFTKLMRPILAYLRARGARVIMYIDDALIMGRSMDECMRHTRMFLDLVHRLGFLVNWDKSILVPTQRIEFLGQVLDSRTMMVLLPQNKLQSTRFLVDQALRDGPTLPIRRVASLLGTLNATSAAVSVARLRTRSILLDKIQALHAARENWSATMTLSSPSMMELEWWRDSLAAWNGRAILLAAPTIALYTDASDTGWGAVLDRQRAAGHWSREQASLHINERELIAIELGLRSFLSLLRDQVVFLRVDNTVAVAYINHQGGTHSPRLSAVSQRIWELSLSNGMLIEASHIPGIDNVLADAASRQTLRPHEWRLHPHIFSLLNRHWGPITIDLFATHLNAQLERYYSWGPDPRTSGLDAMRMEWSGERAYANPPWILIPDILRKIHQEQATVLLIAPVWPSQAWYPRLLELLVATPVLLPTGDRLYCPDQPVVARGLQWWQAAAWPLCGIASLQRDFQRELPLLSANGALRLPDATMIAHGTNGYIGALNGRLIPYTHL